MRTEKQDWVKVLPLAEFAINSVPNASTGTAPFTAVYGMPDAVRLPIDNALQTAVPAAETTA